MLKALHLIKICGIVSDCMCQLVESSQIRQTMCKVNKNTIEKSSFGRIQTEVS